MNRSRIFQYLLVIALALASGIAGFSNQQHTRKVSAAIHFPTVLGSRRRNAKITVVATGFKFTEGPVWDPAGYLYFSDEAGNKIYRLYPGGKKEEVISIGDPDGNTFDRQQQLIHCQVCCVR